MECRRTVLPFRTLAEYWIPACAGTTVEGRSGASHDVGGA